MGSAPTTPEDTGWGKRSQEVVKEKAALHKGSDFILDRYCRGHRQFAFSAYLAMKN